MASPCHCVKSCTAGRHLQIMKMILQSGNRHRICQRSLSACAKSKSSSIPISRNSVSQTMLPWHQSKLLSRQMSIQIPRTLVPRPSQIKSRLDEKPESVEEIVDEASLALLDQIYETNSAQGILDIYDQWEGRFNEVHSARALWCLSQVCKRDAEESEVPQDGNLPATISRTELVKMDGFRNLCTQVLRDSPHMEETFFLTTFDALSKLHVPESSSLVQTLLEQSKHRLNTFSPSSLAHFAFILNNMSSSNSLVKALLDGITLRVPELIDDITSFRSAISLLKIVGKKLPIHDQRKLVNRLTAILSVRQDVDVNGYSVTSSLKSLEGIRGDTKSYCSLAIDFLKDELDQLYAHEVVDLMITLDKLYYYDEEFCQMVGVLITQDIAEVSEPSRHWSVNQLSHICRLYTNWNHLQPDLLNAVAKFVCRGQTKQCSLRQVAHIIQPYAKLDYLPPNEGQFLDFAMNAWSWEDVENEDMQMCITMATYLVQCGRCPERLINFIVDEDSSVTLAFHLRKLHQVMSVRQYETRRQDLGQIVSNMPEDSVQPRSSVKLIKKYKKARSLTKKTLINLVGDACSIMEDVDAGLEYNIDFLLCQGELRQAVVLLDASCYAANVPHHPLMNTKLRQQHLERNGYHVVMMQVEDILTLDSSEDLEAYIQNRIKT